MPKRPLFHLGLGFVFNDRVTAYAALSSGCTARLAFLMALGVTARLTPRTGCMALRIPRGTNKRDQNPTGFSSFGPTWTVTDDVVIPQQVVTHP
jgi:hypothetical protein